MPNGRKVGRGLAVSAAVLMLVGCGSTPATTTDPLPIYPTVQSGQALLPDWDHIPQNEMLPEEEEPENTEKDSQTGEKKDTKEETPGDKTGTKTEDKTDTKTDGNTSGTGSKENTTGNNSGSSGGSGNSLSLIHI